MPEERFARRAKAKGVFLASRAVPRIKMLLACVPKLPTILLCVFGLNPLFVGAQIDVATIIQKSVEANKRDEEALPSYDYREQDRVAHGTKTYVDTMIEGSPYQRLIAINGKELTGSQKEGEQKKFERVLAERRAESPHKRAQRIAKYKAETRRNNNMLAEMAKAFDYKMEGEQEMNDHKVYVLKATPRKGYRPPNRDCQVLTGAEGTLWIDQQTFQWVKIEAHVTRPVSIEGFLAKVEPGTRFELEKSQVEGDIWLPKHYVMAASARVFYMVPHHSQEDDTFYDYHRREDGRSAVESADAVASRAK